MSLEARLQRRIQRYGWDLAADAYEGLWQSQLSPAHRHLLQAAVPGRGERVLDVACGTGLIALAAAAQVGDAGHVTGVDISERMVEVAARRAQALGLGNASFLRMEGERLSCPDAGFDLLYCALGLMYMPEWDHALREMHRVLRPGGRIALAVWGERARCGWSAVFPIVDAEVASDVCPLFFQLGHPRMLAELCAAAVHVALTHKRPFNDALAQYHEARDKRAAPIYDFTTQMATLEPPPPEMQQLMGAVAGSQSSMDAFVSVVAGTMSPIDFFAPEHVGAIMQAAGERTAGAPTAV